MWCVESGLARKSMTKARKQRYDFLVQIQHRVVVFKVVTLAGPGIAVEVL